MLTELAHVMCAESGCCMRQCCGPERGFVMHITNNFNEVSGFHSFCYRFPVCFFLGNNYLIICQTSSPQGEGQEKEIEDTEWLVGQDAVAEIY